MWIYIVVFPHIHYNFLVIVDPIFVAPQHRSPAHLAIFLGQASVVAPPLPVPAAGASSTSSRRLRKWWKVVERTYNII